MRILNPFRRHRPERQPERVYVRAHLDGLTPSLEGWLVGTTPDHYLLDAAALVGTDGRNGLTGLVRVPRGRVVFLQQLHVEVPG